MRNFYFCLRVFNRQVLTMLQNAEWDNKCDYLFEITGICTWRIKMKTGYFPLKIADSLVAEQKPATYIFNDMGGRVVNEIFFIKCHEHITIAFV